MLQPSEITTYQRISNAAAGYCAQCASLLAPGETYCCNECASDAYVETKPNGDSDDN
jgi:uncharacterized OB-fold protein